MVECRTILRAGQTVSVSQKRYLETIDGTPRKRLFHSIISDYDLQTAVCELIDNAIDQWIAMKKSAALEIAISLDVDRQVISVEDNAGGVAQKDAALLVSPGATREHPTDGQVGTFGVGGKRAGVALGEHVEVRTRYKREKSIQIDFTNDWLASDDWNKELYEIPDIEPGTTIVEVSKIRQGFTQENVDGMRRHLGETYALFIIEGCTITLNGVGVEPIVFDVWAYPREFPPRQAAFTIEPSDGATIDVVLQAGLIRDRKGETENYGVYVYCNKRLIVKELKSRDVGYVSGEAGVPHPDASLSRVIIELNGSADVMPWNSSKSGVNFSHPAIAQIRNRVIDFNSYYSTISRRLKGQWEDQVFPYTTGTIEEVNSTVALSPKRKVLPRIPRARRPSRLEQLRAANRTLLDDQPWVVGLIESIGLLDVLQKQKLETKNRVALILLDSNLEIALKEFIVHRTDLFPPYKYNDAAILALFQKRTEVIRAITPHVTLTPVILGKIGHYYGLRNKLIHERTTAAITDKEVADYQTVVEDVLRALFKVRFPRS